MADTAKAKLRENLIAQRSALGHTRRAHADAAITIQLLQAPKYQSAHTIFTYVSVGDEVDTQKIISASFAANKQVCVPRCAKFGQMDAIAITSLDDLEKGKYDLLEPQNGLPLVLPREIDLIIVPCLAATSTGMRIGYGGGFYDRYLATLQADNPTATSIALCRKDFIVKTLPLELHDISVQQVMSG